MLLLLHQHHNQQQRQRDQLNISDHSRSVALENWLWCINSNWNRLLINCWHHFSVSWPNNNIVCWSLGLYYTKWCICFAWRSNTICVREVTVWIGSKCFLSIYLKIIPSPVVPSTITSKVTISTWTRYKLLFRITDRCRIIENCNCRFNCGGSRKSPARSTRSLILNWCALYLIFTIGCSAPIDGLNTLVWHYLMDGCVMYNLSCLIVKTY